MGHLHKVAGGQALEHGQRTGMLALIIHTATSWDSTDTALLYTAALTTTLDAI